MSVFWGTSFGPVEIRLLCAVFEQAWNAIEKSGEVDADASEHCRSSLAVHVIALARAGERDLMRLAAAALRRYRQQRARELAAAFRKIVQEPAGE
ncbi:MAG TPA: hypothetical protein VKT73_06350 [Xanthobacteraceae bacterium]|nr:hypothetical protein [Xanthobacteraceae bacterium]